jgi:hypothetical protein
MIRACFLGAVQDLLLLPAIALLIASLYRIYPLYKVRRRDYYHHRGV